MRTACKLYFLYLLFIFFLLLIDCTDKRYSNTIEYKSSNDTRLSRKESKDDTASWLFNDTVKEMEAENSK